MNNFVGNPLQRSFMPAVTAFYQVHALDYRHWYWCTYSYLRRGYATLSATGAETSLLVTAYRRSGQNLLYVW